MSTITDTKPLQGLITNVTFASGAKATPPPKKSDDNYRYYHCRLDWNGLKCKKVDGPSVLSSEEYTKLLFVNSYIPERLDKQILKYKWIPDQVVIENKST